MRRKRRRVASALCVYTLKKYGDMRRGKAIVMDVDTRLNHFFPTMG